jgi:peroxiredoxin family protein
MALDLMPSAEAGVVTEAAQAAAAAERAATAKDDASADTAAAAAAAAAAERAEQPAPPEPANELSMIVFSGDLDKVLAAFIIACGAAAMDKPVTMFFTFWGLNVLRKAHPGAVKKGLVEKMFGWMMPNGAEKLTLSKMNMGGMGTVMMKRVMAQKNVYSLPKLMETAKEQGVRLIACTMSMDVMGIRAEELIDGVEYGGVATFIDAADRSNTTLFI